MDMSKYIGEATAYDKKLMLERKEPLSWLKSISAFANTSGGVLLYGVDNDGNLVGLENAERDAEDISEMVKPTDKDIIAACYKMALKTLKDKDGVYDIRRYFNV